MWQSPRLQKKRKKRKKGTEETNKRETRHKRKGKVFLAPKMEVLEHAASRI